MGSKIADDPNNEKSLHGIKVLESNQISIRPTNNPFFAALGAQVVKIDDPKPGDPVANSPAFFGKNGVSMSQNSATDVSITYLKRARSKKSIELDLKNAQDLDLFSKLVKRQIFLLRVLDLELRNGSALITSIQDQLTQL